jgi:DNA-binding NarL/FixJ family response regulator
MKAARIRILLADDHALVRAGIRELVHKIPGTEVIGEASSGRQALELIETHRPDLVLLDIGMKELNGLEVAARVARDYPEVRTLILSMHSNEEYVLRALRVGAGGYMLKDAAITELHLAIDSVRDNKTYLSPSISRTAIDNYLNRTASSGKSNSLDQLTPRQREILQLIAEGRSTKEIASDLNLSAKTVETHRALLMERLNIYDVASLVRYAMRVGLIQAE